MLSADGQRVWLLTRVEAVPSELTEEVVNLLLPQVSEQRRADALRYKHLFGRYASLRSYRMLQELLVEAGVMGMEMRPVYAVGGQGKPYLVDYPHIHFNLSHCRTALAVAVSNAPVGIDVESSRPVDDSLLRHTMSPAEVEFVRQSDSPQRAFVELWTRKEALLKQRGTGITDSLRTVLEDCDLAREGLRLETTAEPLFVCTVCSQMD